MYVEWISQKIELEHNIKCYVVHGQLICSILLLFVCSAFKVNLLSFSHLFTVSLLSKIDPFSTGKSSRLQYKMVSSAYFKCKTYYFNVFRHLCKYYKKRSCNRFLWNTSFNLQKHRVNIIIFGQLLSFT